MKKFTCNLKNFFEGDAYPTEKVRQLAARVSVAAYEAGLDVETETIGEVIRVIMTAEKISAADVITLFTLIDEEFRKIPDEYVTRH